jgi:uncharacterized membrane protein
VLRNFLRDRPNQVVLGVFMGTFTYSLLVLRSIRSEDELRGPAFVPNIAITGALVLTFVSLAMLIYFIHHISVRIQVTSIVASVARDTLRTIERLAGWAAVSEDRPWRPMTAPIGAAPAPPSGAIPPPIGSPTATVLHATESGNLQMVDLDALVGAAAEEGGRYRLLVAPGSWVQDRAPLGTFEMDDARPVVAEPHERRMRDLLAVADERSVQQDVAFGIQQLVDIAVKALSPSVNDPTTAMACIDRLVQVLAAAGLDADPPRGFGDRNGVLRLEVPFPGFDELVPLAFDQIRHYGAVTPAVAIHLSRGLSVLLATLPESRHGSLRAQGSALLDAVMRIELAGERQRVLAAVQPLLRGTQPDR